MTCRIFGCRPKVVHTERLLGAGHSGNVIHTLLGRCRFCGAEEHIDSWLEKKFLNDREREELRQHQRGSDG